MFEMQSWNVKEQMSRTTSGPVRNNRGSETLEINE